jgi:hypothetical protein
MKTAGGNNAFLPEAKTFLFFWAGQFMYIGKAVNTALHDHHAIQIAISFNGVFKIKSGDSSRKLDAVIIDSDQPHECRTSDNNFLFLNIAPETKTGAALRNLYLANQSVSELPAGLTSGFIETLSKILAIAFSIGVLSHVIIDLIFHEKDIRLSPFSDSPVWGLGVIDHPLLNFTIEFIYGIFCCWYFKGTRALFWVVILFNISDLPVMLAHGDILQPLKQHPFILPSFILFQILVTWYFVWRFSKRRVPAI